MVDETNEPLDAQPHPQPKMPLGKTVLINFGIMLGYMLTTVMVFSDTGNEAAMGNMAIDAMLIVLQVGLNLLGGIVLLFTDRKDIGRAMLISGLLMGIIGFGACFGKLSLLESL